MRVRRHSRVRGSHHKCDLGQASPLWASAPKLCNVGAELEASEGPAKCSHSTDCISFSPPERRVLTANVPLKFTPWFREAHMYLRFHHDPPMDKGQNPLSAGFGRKGSALAPETGKTRLRFPSLSPLSSRGLRSGPVHPSRLRWLPAVVPIAAQSLRTISVQGLALIGPA